MKKGELLYFRELLRNEMSQPSYSSRSVKFRYAVNRNLEKMDGEVKSLSAIETQNAECLKEYNIERDALIQKHGKATAEGVSVSPEDKESFEAFLKDMEPLNEKYKEAIEAHNKSMEEYRKDILEGEDSETDLYSICINDLPEDLDEGLLRFLVHFNLIKE